MAKGSKKKKQASKAKAKAKKQQQRPGVATSTPDSSTPSSPQQQHQGQNRRDAPSLSSPSLASLPSEENELSLSLASLDLDDEWAQRREHTNFLPSAAFVTGIKAQGRDHRPNAAGDEDDGDTLLGGFENIPADKMVFGPVPNREYHEGFMRKAIEMAELALRSDETPVGCVFVHEGEVIGRGINGTNATLNGTRHAEFVALCEILATYPQSILRNTDLYVTVEPCIMCASALRQYNIRAVYFGCLNDRFGGTGGVMTINADPGVDRTYKVYGGLFREEAIMLLRRFYVQENEKAPEPKPKKNRELKTAILPAHVPPSKGANSAMLKAANAAAAAAAAAKAEEAASAGATTTATDTTPGLVAPVPPVPSEGQ